MPNYQWLQRAVITLSYYVVLWDEYVISLHSIRKHHAIEIQLLLEVLDYAEMLHWNSSQRISQNTNAQINGYKISTYKQQKLVLVAECIAACYSGIDENFNMTDCYLNNTVDNQLLEIANLYIEHYYFNSSIVKLSKLQ